MSLAFLVLGLITGLLLGMVLEKRRCQKKVNKIFDESLKRLAELKEKNEKT